MLLIQGIYKSIFNRIRSKNVSNLLSKRMYIQSGAKIVKLIAKERLLGPTSPIINVELEFEGSGQALHYFSTLIQGWGVGGERGENWVVSRIFAPDCLFFEIFDFEEF